MKAKTRKPSDHDIRVRFNDGYHDAAWEVKNNRLRKRVMDGPHTTTQVSHEHSEAYFFGHQLGQMDTEAGRYNGSSETAWRMVAAKAKFDN